MVIDSTRTILKLPKSLEIGCEDLCDKPYLIERVEQDTGKVQWFGYGVDWEKMDDQWVIFHGDVSTPCEEPEHEQLYQRIIRKKKAHNFDVRFSLSVVGLLLVYAFYSYVKYLFQ